MDKIIIGISVALFITVSHAAIEVSEVIAVPDNKSTISNQLQFTPSKRNKIKSAKYKKSKKNIKSTNHSNQVIAPMTCRAIKNNGAKGYTCQNSKKNVYSEVAGVGAASQNVGAIKAVGKIQYVDPANSTPAFCSAITGNCANNNLNSNIKNAPAVSSDGYGHPYLGIMAGASIAKIGKEQSDATKGEANGYDRYLPDNNYSTVVLYGINGGYEFKLGTKWLLSLGVGIYQNSNYNSEGQIWEKNDDISDIHTLNYEYKLQCTRFMFETQLAWQFNSDRIKLMPFILLGVGPSLNFANSYEETKVTPSASINPFKSNRITSFAYQLGAGIIYPLNNDLDRLFISYGYVDLGKAKFNKMQNSTYQLDVGRIRSNEIYVGYTHLFDF